MPIAQLCNERHAITYVQITERRFAL